MRADHSPVNRLRREPRFHHPSASSRGASNPEPEVVLVRHPRFQRRVHSQPRSAHDVRRPARSGRGRLHCPRVTLPGVSRDSRPCGASGAPSSWDRARPDAPLGGLVTRPRRRDLPWQDPRSVGPVSSLRADQSFLPCARLPALVRDNRPLGAGESDSHPGQASVGRLTLGFDIGIKRTIGSNGAPRDTVG
jgi:hypothetical protein